MESCANGRKNSDAPETLDEKRAFRKTERHDIPTT
jgi:hypothetical protein